MCTGISLQPAGGGVVAYRTGKRVLGTVTHTVLEDGARREQPVQQLRLP